MPDHTCIFFEETVHVELNDRQSFDKAEGEYILALHWMLHCDDPASEMCNAGHSSHVIPFIPIVFGGHFTHAAAPVTFRVPGKQGLHAPEGSK